jgi:hypothetical protein
MDEGGVYHGGALGGVAAAREARRSKVAAREARRRRRVFFPAWAGCLACTMEERSEEEPPLLGRRVAGRQPRGRHATDAGCSSHPGLAAWRVSWRSALLLEQYVHPE